MGIFDRFAFMQKKTSNVGADSISAQSIPQLFQESDIYGLIHYLSNLPDMDETLLAAGLTRRDLRKLETDDEIAAALETRLLGMMSTPFRFEGEHDDDVAFIEAQLLPILDPLMRHVWQAMPYGYSVVEAVYNHQESGRIGIDRMLYKPFWWFKPQTDGGLTPYMMQESLLDTRFKFFLTRRNASYIQPYGEAILSRLYWPWYFRQEGWGHWMRWLARYGTPPLIGTGTQLEELRKALALSVNAAAVAVPEGSTITVANAAAGAGHFPEFETAVTKRIQKMILGQTLTTDVGKTGSYAAAKVQNEVRDDKRIADCKLVCRTVQNVVDALVTLNQMKPVRFMIEDERQLNPDRAERDATLVNAGIVALSQDYLLRAYDYNEDDLMPVVNKPPTNMQAQQGFTFSDTGKGFSPAQSEVEALADDAINQANSPIDEQTIKQIIMAADSPEAMIEALAKLAKDYDPQAFAELTERALFAADVFGFVAADKNQQ